MNIKIQNCLNGLIPFGIINDNNNIDHHAALSPLWIEILFIIWWGENNKMMKIEK